MRNSDQTSPNTALIALRDKYRKLAIRTWDRFESATKILKGRYLRSKMLGFQSRRDYYIYAAEAVGGLVGVPVSVEGDRPESGVGADLQTITPAAITDSTTEVESFPQLTQIQPPQDESQSSIKIDSGLQPAAVATEEK